MTVEHYYATTARIMNDDAKYFVYPLFKTLALAAFRDKHKADVVAGVATTGFYSALTHTFSALEMTSMDQNCRTAVAAELGKKPEDLQYSDYFDSKNAIASVRVRLGQKLFVSRTATDFLPMLPAAMDYGSRAIPGLRDPFLRARGEDKLRAADSSLHHIINGYGMWDMAVYAGKAMYWAYETAVIPKTAHYEIHKIRENKEEVHRKIDANDLIAVLNRSYNDRGLPMIDEANGREAVWPVMEKLAEKMNTSPHFGMSEVVYLIGLDKINIFAKDDQGNYLFDSNHKRVVDPALMPQALAEIERVAQLGLRKIGEENALKNALQTSSGARHEKPESFVSQVTRGFANLQFDTYQALVGKRKLTPQEYISSRDLGEVPGIVS